MLELKGHGYTNGKVIIAHCGNPAAAERLMHMVKAVFEGAQVRVTECGGCAATTPSWAASWWASRTRTPELEISASLRYTIPIKMLPKGAGEAQMFFRLPVVRFFNRVINRATVTVALVLLQIGWLLWAFFSLTAGKVWVNAG